MLVIIPHWIILVTHLPHTLFYKLKIAVKLIYRIPFVHKRPYWENKTKYFWIKDKGMKHINSEMQFRFKKIVKDICIFLLVFMLALRSWVPSSLYNPLHISQISMGLLCQCTFPRTFFLNTLVKQYNVCKENYS